MEINNKKNNWQQFIILAILIMIAICSMLGVDIHLASMPAIMHYLHTDKSHMQQSISVYLLGMGASLLFYGPLSDRFGRKPVVIAGMLVASIASYACVLSHTIHFFLVMRLLQGIGAGACMGLARVIVADLLKGNKMATIGSYVSMAISISPLCAPALGGYIQHWFDWQANFIVLGSFILVSVALFALFCPETNRFKQRDACDAKIVIANYKSLLSHKLFVGCTLITGIVMAATMAYATCSSFILQMQFHVSPVVYGWLTTAVASGGLLGKTCAAVLIRKLGRQKTLMTGVVLLLAAGVFMAIVMSLHLISIPVIMIAVFTTVFAQAQVAPTAISYALSPFHDKRGAAGALYGSFQMLVAFVSSAIVAAFSHGGVLVLTVSYLLLGFIGVTVCFWVKPLFATDY